ncbi:MAG: hypothetical protein JO167_00560, partial [Alphaproteobacteria bacterium]|nr:hypothetical protein [Alphaproteobacteria bacterium]
MFLKSLRTAFVAFAVGAATVAVTAVALTAPAEAAARAVVGNHLKAAISQANSGNYAAARASLAAAEGVGGLTAGDQAAIAQVRQYIAAKSGAGGTSGCAGLYLKGDYRGVINAGGGDAQCTQLKAQAYYLIHDYAGCTRYIRNAYGSGAGEQVLTLLMRCAYENQDNESMRTALEQLVSRTNKPEYWSQLLTTAEGTKGLKDHQTLDIYRIKLMTGSINKPEQYMLLAQIALQLGCAAEAQAVLKKGVDAKVLQPNDRLNRLMAMAGGQAATNAANAGRAAAGNGDALIKLSEDLWGQGKYDDALKFAKAGIAKGVSDQPNA